MKKRKILAEFGTFVVLSISTIVPVFAAEEKTEVTINMCLYHLFIVEHYEYNQGENMQELNLLLNTEPRFTYIK